MDFQYATVEVDVRPLQPQQFAPPKSGGKVEVVELVHAAVFGLLEECAELIRGQGFHLLVFDFWQRTALCGIFRDEALFHGKIVRRTDHLVDISHRLGRQTFRLFLGLDAVYPATVQQMLVEPLQVQRSEICQRDAANLRLDVILEKALRGFEGRWAEFHLGVVLHPHFQPCSHRVGLGPSVVDAHVFLYGFLQLLLDRSLRLSENIFDDGFSGFRIVTDSVSALPAAILSFADVPFPVCSSFRHGISPFRNEQYRNQGNKATRKSNCYQKVIICPSEPRRLIFDYCGAIFALPEAFFFDYSGAIFERSRSPFHCLQRRKICTICAENRSYLEITFLNG